MFLLLKSPHLVISPTTLLFVLNGVHVVQEDCTVLIAPARTYLLLTIQPSNLTEMSVYISCLVLPVAADWELCVVVLGAGRTSVLGLRGGRETRGEMS